MTILKTTARETIQLQLFIREASKTFNSFSNGGRYIADFVKCPGLNVTAESSSKFKLVVNAYGCFVESDEHNEGHKLRNV